MIRTVRNVIISSVALLAASALAGCTSVEPPSGLIATEGSNLQVPSFDGPWKSELASAYRASTSEFERDSLNDGSISSTEFAEMQSNFDTCLTEQNMTWTGFNPDGSYDFEFGDSTTGEQATGLADTCEAASGVDTVGFLYFSMKRNPEHIDESELMAACLVSNQAVAEGYTASDYSRDATKMAFPFLDKKLGESALFECSSDPLNLLD